jgi:MFS superfamily sulfate permease-like transporter
MIASSSMVLLVLLFLTGPLAYLPSAVLSTVVVLIGFHLIDIAGMRQIYRERPWEFWVALITTATVVLIGVEPGILLALLLSLVIHTRHGYRPKNALIVQDPSGGWKTQPVATRAQLLPGLLYYRFTHGLYYANAEVLSDEVIELARTANPPLVWFCLDATAIDDVDFTAAAILRTLYGILREKKSRLILSGVSPEVHAQLGRSGIPELIGRDAFYTTGIEMVRAYQQQRRTPS